MRLSISGSSYPSKVVCVCSHTSNLELIRWSRSTPSWPAQLAARPSFQRASVNSRIHDPSFRLLAHTWKLVILASKHQERTEPPRFIGEMSTTLVIWTILLVALAFLYSTWRRHVETQAFKRRHGCQDPPRYPHRDRIWGSDLVRERRDAMKNGRYFKLYESQFERYGKTF